MYDALNGQFQQHLGRTISPDEYQFLSKFINEGSLQPQEIGQLIQGLPEYQQRLLGQNTDAYGQRLAASDQDVLGKAGAAINSQFAGMGRPVSSAQAGALAGVGQNLAMQRQSALADFYGRGLQQNAALTAQQGQGALARGYGLRDETRNRAYQIEDYYRQKNDFADYQNAHSGWNAITPELVTNGLFKAGGMALGGYLGGKAGAVKALPTGG